jgi:hypothetical protein
MNQEIKFASVQVGEIPGGMSESARYIEQRERQGRTDLPMSAGGMNLPLNAVRNELIDVILECSKLNWNGYDARPIKPNAIQDAFRLAQVIPLGIPAPSIGAEPDGDITFEWYSAPRKTLSVSVDDCGNLHYAALLGPDSVYGTEAFVGVLPKRILDLIYQVKLE